MDLLLQPEEVRVLGSLLEKEVTTPEYYPLSLNTLVNACNQKSNRDPVVEFDADTVEQAAQLLRDKGLLVTITGAGSRVPKYGHRISEKLNLGRRELAIMCELMVRGPQTLGELRTHCERMHKFDDLAEVEAVIERLPELVVRLSRRPGEKEVRYAHLLSGTPVIPEASEEAPPAREGRPDPVAAGRGPDRIAALESEVARLRDEIENLKQQFAGFKRQFE
ncbi:MAG TPA: YceH family protein [Bryobacteraceae bacterium]|nr:YceH family protein [Bryobacteraceae bacterium]